MVDAPKNIIDAPFDVMPTATDLDGDGVPNTTDNCPNYVNPGQGNEDGDPLGDPCDPCPIDPANPPSDPDNDGVSDSCDPRPTTAGDTLVVFDGFHGGVVPGNWQVLGTATPMGDDVNLTAEQNAGIVPPGVTPANGMVMMKATVRQTLGQYDSTLAIVMKYDAGQGNGVYCELYAPNAGSTNNRDIDIWDSIPQATRGQKAYNWQTNVPYTLTMRKTGNAYQCQVTPAAGSGETVSGNTSSNPGTGAGAFIYGANVNISWLLVVASP